MRLLEWVAVKSIFLHVSPLLCFTLHARPHPPLCFLWISVSLYLKGSFSGPVALQRHSSPFFTSVIFREQMKWTSGQQSSWSTDGIWQVSFFFIMMISHFERWMEGRREYLRRGWACVCAREDLCRSVLSGFEKLRRLNKTGHCQLQPVFVNH